MLYWAGGVGGVLLGTLGYWGPMGFICSASLLSFFRLPFSPSPAVSFVVFFYIISKYDTRMIGHCGEWRGCISVIAQRNHGWGQRASTYSVDCNRLIEKIENHLSDG